MEFCIKNWNKILKVCKVLSTEAFSGMIYKLHATINAQAFIATSSNVLNNYLFTQSRKILMLLRKLIFQLNIYTYVKL
jgi:hypothetical protein